MKKLIIIFLILFAVTNSYARGWYFATSGNDATGSGTIGAPYQTITKLNAIFSSFSAGDFVYFNGGDTFYGTITVTKSGSSGSPITITSYGTGNATITGFANVTSWANLGGNIWESTSTVSSLATCNIVAINGINTAMGRYPNTGWVTYQSHSGNTSITSSSLSGTPNWTGAEAVIRKNRYIIDRNAITAQSSGTLTYTTGSGISPNNNYGFFIQNDIRTLDTANEWYYNPSTKKIDVYSISSPTGVQVSSVDTLLNLKNYSYLTFTNIDFTGSNKVSAKTSTGGQNITFTYCNFNFSGNAAIDLYPGTQNSIISNCTFSNSNDFALNAGASKHVTITNNTIKNSGVYPGMGALSSAFDGISATGTCNISYNTIDSSGYVGINFDGDSSQIVGNLVTNFCFNVDDGGGIYSFPSQGPKINVRRTIKNNIVINGVGAGAGTDAPTSNQAMGIYLDGTCSDFDVIGNSISTCASGLFLNNNHQLLLYKNTVFDCSHLIDWENYSTTVPMDTVYINKNIAVAKTSSELAVFAKLQNSTMPASYRADSNYYARPIDDNLAITYGVIGSGMLHNINLASWQTFTSQDVHSNKSPKSITSTDSLTFLYNATASSTITTLPYNYIDMAGTSYNGTITLQPYTSAVLIQNGSATGGTPPPVVNAGVDQIIYLPATNTTMAGSVIPATGHTATYLWSTISGGGTPVFSDITILNPVITALTLGSHVFRLTATQDDSQTEYDEVNVTVVNPASQTWTHPLPITFVNH